LYIDATIKLVNKVIYYSGPQELGGPGSLNRLNLRFLRHCTTATGKETHMDIPVF